MITSRKSRSFLIIRRGPVCANFMIQNRVGLAIFPDLHGLGKPMNRRSSASILWMSLRRMNLSARHPGAIIGGPIWQGARVSLDGRADNPVTAGFLGFIKRFISLAEQL